MDNFAGSVVEPEAAIFASRDADEGMLELSLQNADDLQQLGCPDKPFGG